MKEKTLLKFIQTLVNLKNNLKCPICLDLMQDVAELSCGHRFCGDCFSRHKSTQKIVRCPTCRKIMNSRTFVYKDSYTNAVGKFVADWCQHIRNIYNCEIEQLKDTLEACEELLQKDICNIEVLPSTSKLVPTNIQTDETKIDEKLNCNAKKSTAVLRTNCEDAFDELLGASERVFRRGIAKKVYTNKKPQTRYKNLDFDYDENRLAVLSWLNDTRNDFQRTVTQFDPCNNETKLQSSVPIDSVSQSKIIDIAPKKMSIQRASSLDIEIHRPIRKETSHSHCGVFEPEEEYNIEESEIDLKKIILETKKKVLMTMLEEECIKRYDRDFRENKNSKNEDKAKKTDEKVSSLHASGWGRLSEINKSLKKKEKVPRKLNVTLQTSQTSNAKVGMDKKFANKSCYVALEAGLDIIDKEKPKNDTRLITCQDFEEFVTKTENKENKDPHQEDDLDLLYSMPTQKLKGCDNHNKSTEKEDDVIVIGSDDDEDLREIFSNPTQKFVFNELYSDKNKDFHALLQLFETDLEKCFADLDTENVASIKTNLNNLKSVLQKFKSLRNFGHSREQKYSQETQTENQISTNDIGVQIGIQTERKDTDCQTDRQVKSVHSQTINHVRTVQVQTERFLNSVQVQTEQFVDSLQVKNEDDLIKTNPGSGNTIKSLSQGTKDAMMLMLNDSESLKPVTQKPVTQNIFTPSLDNLCFETQDLLRKNEKLALKHVDKPEEEEKKVSSQTSVLVCTADPTNSNKSKRKLSNELDVSRKYKRIRRPSTDSDLEDEGVVNNKKNRFIRDDLTVQFQTCTNKNSVRNAESKDESQNSENVDYDKYLAQVMARYNEESMSPVSEKDKMKDVPISQRQLKINDNHVDDMQILLQKVNPKNVSSSRSSKESFHTPPQEYNFLDEPDVFMDEKNLEKLDRDILEYETKLRQHSTEISDIIGETESMEPVPKKKKTLKKNIPKKQTVSNTDFVVDNEDLDLNDNLKELPKRTKINVISNVVIKNPESKGEVQDAEKDLFSEDDEDIIEMTPEEKNNTFSERMIFSQKFGKLNTSQKIQSPPAFDSGSLDFDIANLPPPPDFRDDACNNFINLVTPTNEIIEMESDNDTPENLLLPSKLREENQDRSNDSVMNNSDKENRDENRELRNVCLKKEHDENDQSLTPDRPSQFILMSRQQKDSEALNFTPISQKSSQRSSIFENLQSSRYNPLTIVRKEPASKRNKLTSIPKQTSIWNYVNNSPTTTTRNTTMPCISWTRLNNSQISSIMQLEDKNLARCKSNLDSDVTHLIVNVNEKNYASSQTFKYVTAVAAGIWILGFKWVEECLDKNEIVPEEPFEALDVSGRPGPKNSRLFRLQNPLLKGFTFYCKPPFTSGTREQFEEIVRLAGGKVVPSPNDLLKKDGNIKLILAESATTQDFDLLHEKWVNQYKAVPVEMMWLVNSVGQYQLKSLRSHMYCPENYLTQLNYPSFLGGTEPSSDDTPENL